MWNSKQLLFLTFLSLIICSYARKNIISSSPGASPSQLPVGSDANHITISSSLHVDTPYSSPPVPHSQGNFGNVSPCPSQAPKSQKVCPFPSQTLGGVSSSLSPKAALTPSSSPIVIDGQSNKWCGKTDYPDLCVEMISSLKNNSDLNAAVNVAIKQTEDTAKAGMEKISKLPQVKSKLIMYQDYLQSVQDSLDDFENAQYALTQKQMRTLNEMITAALIKFGDEGYLPKGPVVPEVAQFNKRLYKMTIVCLHLSALLDPGEYY